MGLNIRAVTHILKGRDDKAKAIKEILDLFLPTFRNLDKHTPILIDLPKGLSASVIGTGVSVLTDLYYEIEINPETHTSNEEYIIKGALRDFENFSSSALDVTKDQLQVIFNYKLELKSANSFDQITPELFMACVILEIYKRCGMCDFDLFNRANVYYKHCMDIVELMLKSLSINASVIANPVFGCIDHMIQGDGDFILDGNLFDIKTTKSINVDKNSRRQLLFYYLMNHKESSSMPYETKYDISKLYIYKARHGVSIEIPINLRGVNPLNVIKTITSIETNQIAPSKGIEIVNAMIKEDLEPKIDKKKSVQKLEKKKKAHKFKIKKAYMCSETSEVFDSVIKANEKYGFSKNIIYKYLEGSIKCTTTKYGTKLTWRVVYKII